MQNPRTKPAENIAHPKHRDSSNPIRVILADDHPILRQTMTSVLETDPGIKVVAQASNGLEAIELTNQTNPDVILMDIAMPEMDGVDATRAIREQDSKIGIIGLSFNNSSAEAMYEAGASAYLMKGCSSDELITAIYKHAR